MDLDTITIRAGARLNFTIERADADAVSATFLAVYGSHSITDTVNYDADGFAAFQFDSPDTDFVGDYEYQVSENFATGSPDIYPNFDNCDGDCDLPTLQICESLSIGSS
jgi:hypothetical protein